MVRCVFAHLWDQCPQSLKDLAHTFKEEPPKALLLFDYCANFPDLEEKYKEQNPEVSEVEISTVKFLPQEVWNLISDDVAESLFAKNMFTLLLAWRSAFF